jgi:hypothetical protein
MPSPHRNKLTILPAAALALCVTAASAQPAPFSVSLGGQSITITPAHSEDLSAATVQLGAQKFKILAGKQPPDAPVDLRTMTTVKNGYLLLENYYTATGWRTDSVTVFTIRNGALKRLGEIDADPIWGPPGSNRFIDIDDQLEMNHLTGHTDAPGVTVALRDMNGKLVYDPAWCWRLNAGHYDKATKDLAANRNDSLAAASLLLNLAVIDRYCHRDRELAADLSRAHAVLPKDYDDLLKSELSTLQIGKRPKDNLLLSSP